MAISFDKDEIVFSSGKRIYCCDGTFGLSPEEDDYNHCVSYGSEGSIGVGTIDYVEIGPAEAVELADAMIARWQAFKETWLKQSSMIPVSEELRTDDEAAP